MKIWNCDIKICATAYVRAESEDEARALIDEHFGEGEMGILPSGDGGAVTVSGLWFDAPNLPDVSISPAVTFYGPWADEDGTADVDIAG